MINPMAYMDEIAKSRANQKVMDFLFDKDGNMRRTQNPEAELRDFMGKLSPQEKAVLGVDESMFDELKQAQYDDAIAQAGKA